MRWQGREKSENVIDRRRSTTRKVGTGIGVGTILVVILGLLMGDDPSTLLRKVAEQAASAPVEQLDQSAARPDDELAEFVKVVLKDTEDVWNKVFRT